MKVYNPLGSATSSHRRESKQTHSNTASASQLPAHRLSSAGPNGVHTGNYPQVSGGDMTQNIDDDEVADFLGAVKGEGYGGQHERGLNLKERIEIAGN